MSGSLGETMPGLGGGRNVIVNLRDKVDTKEHRMELYSHVRVHGHGIIYLHLVDFYGICR